MPFQTILPVDNVVNAVGVPRVQKASSHTHLAAPDAELQSLSVPAKWGDASDLVAAVAVEAQHDAPQHRRITTAAVAKKKATAARHDPYSPSKCTPIVAVSDDDSISTLARADPAFDSLFEALRSQRFESSPHIAHEMEASSWSSSSEGGCSCDTPPPESITPIKSQLTRAYGKVAANIEYYAYAPCFWTFPADKFKLDVSVTITARVSSHVSPREMFDTMAAHLSIPVLAVKQMKGYRFAVFFFMVDANVRGAQKGGAAQRRAGGPSISEGRALLGSMIEKCGAPADIDVTLEVTDGAVKL